MNLSIPLPLLNIGAPIKQIAAAIDKVKALFGPKEPAEDDADDEIAWCDRQW